MEKEVKNNKRIYFSPQNLRWKNKYLGFVNKKQIWFVVSKNFKKWKIKGKPILKPRKGYFDSKKLHILNIFSLKQDIFLLYFVNNPFCIGAALLSKKDPKKVLWRSANAIYKSNKKIIPIIALKKGNLVKIKVKYKNKLGMIEFSLSQVIPYLFKSKPFHLKKPKNNPILKPDTKNYWGNKATFNPAALYLKEDGKVHFIYRAIGQSNVSVLGYACSLDGVYISEKSQEPVFAPDKSFENRQGKKFSYGSGGSWGGCEDPRLTRIKDTIYMTYTAFDGVSPPRIAITYIKKKDFLQKHWLWQKPVFISPPGEINKNWVIFPEKINGKYAILHSISPKILIDYFDDLDFDGNAFINSCYNAGDRDNSWDNIVRGAGPPPIKTKDGWLLLYHAMDKDDPGRYKLGAMVLDLKNPKKILYRSPNPILEPDKSYENNGFKAGVIYCCGAVVKENKLFVYYGGSDKVTCVAVANLNDFLNNLKNAKKPSLKIA